MSEFWLGLALGACFGFFMGLLLAGLLRCASDAELRLAHHVRQKDLDEHAEEYDEHTTK